MMRRAICAWLVLGVYSIGLGSVGSSGYGQKQAREGVGEAVRRREKRKSEGNERGHEHTGQGPILRLFLEGVY